jgi:hypothetical protein
LGSYKSSEAKPDSKGELKMATKGHQPGGGIASRVNVETRVRTGGGSRAVREPAVGQIGGSYGDHTTNQGETGWRPGPLYGGRGMNPVPYGNAKALDVGKGGCGTGRTLYGKAGSQGQYGSGGPQKPQGRPILSEYAPDYKVPGR